MNGRILDDNHHLVESWTGPAVEISEIKPGDLAIFYDDTFHTWTGLKHEPTLLHKSEVLDVDIRGKKVLVKWSYSKAVERANIKYERQQRNNPNAEWLPIDNIMMIHSDTPHEDDNQPEDETIVHAIIATRTFTIGGVETTKHLVVWQGFNRYQLYIPAKSKRKRVDQNCTWQESDSIWLFLERADVLIDDDSDLPTSPILRGDSGGGGRGGNSLPSGYTATNAAPSASVASIAESGGVVNDNEDGDDKVAEQALLEDYFQNQDDYGNGGGVSISGVKKMAPSTSAEQISDNNEGEKLASSSQPKNIGKKKSTSKEAPPKRKSRADPSKHAKPNTSKPAKPNTSKHQMASRRSTLEAHYMKKTKNGYFTLSPSIKLYNKWRLQITWPLRSDVLLAIDVIRKILPLLGYGRRKSFILRSEESYHFESDEDYMKARNIEISENNNEKYYDFLTETLDTKLVGITFIANRGGVKVYRRPQPISIRSHVTSLLNEYQNEYMKMKTIINNAIPNETEQLKILRTIFDLPGELVMSDIPIIEKCKYCFEYCDRILKQCESDVQKKLFITGVLSKDLQILLYNTMTGGKKLVGNVGIQVALESLMTMYSPTYRPSEDSSSINHNKVGSWGAGGSDGRVVLYNVRPGLFCIRRVMKEDHNEVQFTSVQTSNPLPVDEAFNLLGMFNNFQETSNVMEEEIHNIQNGSILSYSEMYDMLVYRKQVAIQGYDETKHGTFKLTSPDQFDSIKVKIPCNLLWKAYMYMKEKNGIDTDNLPLRLIDTELGRAGFNFSPPVGGSTSDVSAYVDQFGCANSHRRQHIIALFESGGTNISRKASGQSKKKEGKKTNKEVGEEIATKFLLLKSIANNRKCVKSDNTIAVSENVASRKSVDDMSNLYLQKKGSKDEQAIAHRYENERAADNMLDEDDTTEKQATAQQHDDLSNNDDDPSNNTFVSSAVWKHLTTKGWSTSNGGTAYVRDDVVGEYDKDLVIKVAKHMGDLPSREGQLQVYKCSCCMYYGTNVEMTSCEQSHNDYLQGV